MAWSIGVSPWLLGGAAHHRGAPRVAVQPVPGGWAGVGEAVTEVSVEEELHTGGTDMRMLPHYAPAHQWYAKFLQ